MSAPADQPLTTPEAWAATTNGDGVWIRHRSGPRPKSRLREVETSTWHRVGDVAGYSGRIRSACGYGPRDGFTWPSGRSRLEVARPLGFGSLPGNVCPVCRNWPVTYPSVTEPEVAIADALDLDALADAVAQRLIDRVDTKRDSDS